MYNSNSWDRHNEAIAAQPGVQRRCMKVAKPECAVIMCQADADFMLEITSITEWGKHKVCLEHKLQKENDPEIEIKSITVL